LEPYVNLAGRFAAHSQSFNLVHRQPKSSDKQGSHGLVFFFGGTLYMNCFLISMITYFEIILFYCEN
jgi:hypothetical protein